MDVLQLTDEEAQRLREFLHENNKPSVLCVELIIEAITPHGWAFAISNVENLELASQCSAIVFSDKCEDGYFEYEYYGTGPTPIAALGRALLAKIKPIDEFEDYEMKIV